MISATILSRRGNWAVVQLPSRQFPALALQGDTFFVLVDSLRRGMAAPTEPDCRDELAGTLADMESALSWYAKILKEHGMETPWREAKEGTGGKADGPERGGKGGIIDS